jgi:hypothetical protein
MESGLSAVPRSVAGPLQLAPFGAVSLAPRRVGDPASARVFARPYRGVAGRLDGWCKRGLATRDETPAIYLHEYTDSGLTIRGLVGCLDLSHRADVTAPGQVLPHEAVHPRQVRELARRMEAMGVHPAPILLVHRGPASIREVCAHVRATSPQREYVDHAGQEHRVWRIRDPAHRQAVDAGLRDARLLVADGHHRYAAYLALRDRDPRPAHRTGLAMVVDQDDTPLFLGAIHRLLHGTDVRAVLDAVQRAGGVVSTIAGDRAVRALAPDTFVLSDGDLWATARLEVPSGEPMVQVVDSTVLPCLDHAPTRVGFAHSVAEALTETRPGRVTAALLPAVGFDAVLDIVSSGRILPEKATSFQPKPSLGSFIRLLDESVAPA